MILAKKHSMSLQAVMLGVPQQLILEEMRLTNHHLQCAIDVRFTKATHEALPCRIFS